MNSYLGMDAQTGLRITNRVHLDQSIKKIIGTSIGTRLRRRPFGSMAPDLIDAPANPGTILQLYAAAATALMSWEPRLRLHQITARVLADPPGAIEITVTGETVPDALGVSTPITAVSMLGT